MATPEEMYALAQELRKLRDSGVLSPDQYRSMGAQLMGSRGLSDQYPISFDSKFQTGYPAFADALRQKPVIPGRELAPQEVFQPTPEQLRQQLNALRRPAYQGSL